jgi:hypothetical protein
LINLKIPKWAIYGFFFGLFLIAITQGIIKVSEEIIQMTRDRGSFLVVVSVAIKSLQFINKLPRDMNPKFINFIMGFGFAVTIVSFALSGVSLF